MVLRAPAPVDRRPLAFEEVEDPVPREHDLLVRVERCGVCRTDLHVVEGDLPSLRERVIPGHEVVGEVVGLGAGVVEFREGQRVGVPWLRSTCGRCGYCRTGRENLCDRKEFTGYSEDGGYAELVTVPEGFALPLPPGEADRMAPLLCAGIIGYRAFKLSRPAPGGRIGFFGFGGSAHLTLQLAHRLGFETVAYARRSPPLDLARALGADATERLGGPQEAAAHPSLDAAIVFAPAGEVVIQALRRLRKGGHLAIAGIHLSPIPPIDYDRLLFGERVVQSVEANTRADAAEFLALALRLGVTGTTTVRPLREANEALLDLQEDRVVGTVVLDPTTGGGRWRGRDRLMPPDR